MDLLQWDTETHLALRRGDAALGVEEEGGIDAADASVGGVVEAGYGKGPR